MRSCFGVHVQGSVGFMRGVLPVASAALARVGAAPGGQGLGRGVLSPDVGCCHRLEVRLRPPSAL